MIDHLQPITTETTPTILQPHPQPHLHPKPHSQPHPQSATVTLRTLLMTAAAAVAAAVAAAAAATIAIAATTQLQSTPSTVHHLSCKRSHSTATQQKIPKVSRTNLVQCAVMRPIQQQTRKFALLHHPTPHHGIENPFGVVQRQ